MTELASLLFKRVVLEVTGGLELAAAVHLSQAGLPVAVVSAGQLRQSVPGVGEVLAAVL